MPPLESSPNQLLVEGSDDQHSVVHLLARNGVGADSRDLSLPFVRVAGGIPEVLKVFPELLKGPYSRVGCVVDANASLPDRWAQLRDRARRAGVALPEAPDPGGTVVEGRRPGTWVGVWLMPDNVSPGILEDLLRSLIPEDNPPWLYAEEAVVEARRRGAPCAEKDHSKSRLHTWLAWQETPGLPFGTALKAEVLRCDSELALRFVSWCKRLFTEP